MTRRVAFVARGLRPETLLKRLARESIRVFHAKAGDGEIAFECLLADTERVQKAAGALGYALSAPSPVGFARTCATLRRRVLLALCLTLAALAVTAAMTRVWFVRVLDAGEYAGEVRAALEEMDVRPMIKKSAVDTRALQEALEWRFPKLRWAQVALSGVTLQVRVVRGVSPDNGGAAGDVVAKRAGIVRSVLTYAGTPLVKPGDTVAAGQTLILAQERGFDGAALPVSARGEVLASVYVEARASVPLNTRVSIPTGRESAARLIELSRLTLRFGATPDFLTYDTERTVMPLGGAFFPVRLMRERYAEVALEDRARSADEAKKEAGTLALRRLSASVFRDEVIDKWVDYSMIGRDHVLATATAEVLTDIAARGAEPIP